MSENSRGRVIQVSTSEVKGEKKTRVAAAQLVPDWGIEGDAHAGSAHRQVSLLAIESIDKMREKGLDVGPGAFAENITTESVTLPELSIGDRLRFGGVLLEITQIGKECHSRCAIFIEAGDCVMPMEGVFARVIEGGEIEAGDEFDIVRSVDSG